MYWWATSHAWVQNTTKQVSNRFAKLYINHSDSLPKLRKHILNVKATGPVYYCEKFKSLRFNSVNPSNISLFALIFTLQHTATASQRECLSKKELRMSGMRRSSASSKALTNIQGSVWSSTHPLRNFIVFFSWSITWREIVPAGVRHHKISFYTKLSDRVRETTFRKTNWE